MTHPLPQSLALIVKAEAENSWNDFRNKAIPGTEGTVQSGYFGYAAFPQTAYCHGFSAAAQFLFAHLAEPGEACGPRGWVYLPAFGMKYPGSYRTAPLRIDERPDFKPQHPEDAQYVPLTELLQARAAGATALEANRLNHEILRSSMAESWSAELEAAKAALASSEARVRVLTAAVEFYANKETYGTEDSSRATGNEVFDIVCFDFDRNLEPGKDYAGRRARQALLEVQR